MSAGSMPRWVTTPRQAAEAQHSGDRTYFCPIYQSQIVIERCLIRCLVWLQSSYDYLSPGPAIPALLSLAGHVWPGQWQLRRLSHSRSGTVSTASHSFFARLELIGSARSLSRHLSIAQLRSPHKYWPPISHQLPPTLANQSLTADTQSMQCQDKHHLT